MNKLAEIISEVSGEVIHFENVSEKKFGEICGYPESAMEIMCSLYRAVDNNEFGIVTDHIELLTGTPPESVESYLRRKLLAK